ncbi:MAG: hypothetical protein ACPL3B_05870 [Fervidobacterium sp.]
MHIGSSYALMPPQFDNILASKRQKKIFQYWKKMCDSVGQVDTLVLLGDIVDGCGKATNGRELWTTDVDKQLQCAKELVDMIKYDKSVIVYGSEYHVEGNLNADQAFGNLIGCSASGWELVLRPKGSRGKIHVSHTVSVSSSAWQYRTTAIAKELMFALLNSKEMGEYRAVVRGHAHYYCFVQYSTNMGWVNPCWQMRTPYLSKRGLALIPKLGYTTLTIEGDEWKHGVETFELPPPEVIEV